MHESFDVESQSGTHGHDIFTIQLLQYCSLASIVKSTGMHEKVGGNETLPVPAHRKSIRISFSFIRFFLIIVRSPIRNSEARWKMK